MWDMLGLECLYDVDLHMNRNNEWDKKKIVSILKEEKLPEKPPQIPLQHMILRAKVNSQRCYEIYEFNIKNLRKYIMMSLKPLLDGLEIMEKKSIVTMLNKIER